MEQLDLKYHKLKKKRIISQKRKEELCGYLFILVPVLGFIMFTLTSLGYSLYMSFTDFNPIKGTFTFVGLNNYIEIFQEENFKSALVNTIIMSYSVKIKKCCKSNTFSIHHLVKPSLLL